MDRSTDLGNLVTTGKHLNTWSRLIDHATYCGKTVLIDFWAAWCRACRVENPKLVGIYKEYKDHGLEIISISQDHTAQQWEKAIEKDGIGAWAQIRDEDGTISNSYSISSLPQNVLLDKSGKIIAKNINADQLKEILVGELEEH